MRNKTSLPRAQIVFSARRVLLRDCGIIGTVLLESLGQQAGKRRNPGNYLHPEQPVSRMTQEDRKWREGQYGSETAAERE